MITVQQRPEFSGRNRYQLAFQKLDVKRQLVVVLDALGRTHMHRNKFVGNLTKKARAYITFQFINDLKACGFPLRNILNLDQRHLKAIIQLWQAHQLAPSTIMTRYSILKWLLTAIGKRGMLMPPDYYGLLTSDTERSYIADHDKSWSTNLRIPVDIIETIRLEDPWVGVQLELMREFGLRIHECVMLQPLIADCGTQLKVESGTKGGRTRFIPIDKDSQRRVLDCAKEMAKHSSRGRMTANGLNPNQAKNRIYTLCGKHGITKAQLGATPHGLRHQFCNDLFEDVAGFPSIVRNGPVIRDRLKDEAARHATTGALGHKRSSITAAYTGARIQGRPKSNGTKMALQVRALEVLQDGHRSTRT